MIQNGRRSIRVTTRNNSHCIRARALEGVDVQQLSNFPPTISPVGLSELMIPLNIRMAYSRLLP